MSSDYDIQPVLKWAGGKRKLVPEIKQFYENLKPKKYIEPFFGGGAVYFDILKTFGKKSKENSIINDKNEDLIDMYKNIKNSPAEVIYHCKRLKKDYEKNDYYFIRAKFNGINQNGNKVKKYQGIERSAALILINKTCFNGLYRVNKSGLFNVPKGDQPNPTIVDEENLYKLSSLLPKSKNIRCQEFDEIKNINKGDLVYFDPPYHPLNQTSSFTSYSGAFGKDEQIRLRDYFSMLNKKGVYVILSNSSSDFIKELYKKFTLKKVHANRAINSKADKRKGVYEFIVLGDHILNK
tara:strand:- start:1998 stop:2879 length:882 start_codon:yes stop_codon:yes gene_type:complete